jgi:hypothetical protein
MVGDGGEMLREGLFRFTRGGSVVRFHPRPPPIPENHHQNLPIAPLAGARGTAAVPHETSRPAGRVLSPDCYNPALPIGPGQGADGNAGRRPYTQRGLSRDSPLCCLAQWRRSAGDEGFCIPIPRGIRPAPSLYHPTHPSSTTGAPRVPDAVPAAVTAGRRRTLGGQIATRRRRLPDRSAGRFSPTGHEPDRSFSPREATPDASVWRSTSQNRLTRTFR